MPTVEVILWVLLGIGVLFNALGVIGILRFPDVYTRLHADTKATTFGSIFLGAAVVVHAVNALVSAEAEPDPQYLTLAIHAAVAVLVLAFTNATGAHAIARAAHKSGALPDPSIVNRLAEKE